MIAGSAGRHRLKTIKGRSTRPTSGRVKESLFNIIAGYLTGADILDLFAGTGSLGIEALSRGANSAVFVDMSQECQRVIKENLVHTKLLDKSSLVKGDVSLVIQKLGREGRKFDIIFMDPPYRKNFLEETLQTVSYNGIIKNDGIIVTEHNIDDKVPDTVGMLEVVKNTRYGNTVLTFYALCIENRKIVDKEGAIY